MNRQQLWNVVMSAAMALLAVSAIAEEERVRTTEAYSPRGVYQEVRVAHQVGVGMLQAPTAAVHVKPSTAASDESLVRIVEEERPGAPGRVALSVTPMAVGLGTDADSQAPLSINGDTFLEGALAIPPARDLICTGCVGSAEVDDASDINKDQVQSRLMENCEKGYAINAIDRNGCPRCLQVGVKDIIVSTKTTCRYQPPTP